ncbi:TPA: hypothetical protein DEP58_04605 [Patescibacteria group bacterium]|nr:MAG: hypothetical protein UU98_C0028G0037 [Parcubacteria group bacterium GW2011_GWD2_42_14]HCC05547.1 hypothetical protein [Patescibacteria group bacterium]
MQKQHLAVIILFICTLLLGVVSFLLPKEAVSPTPEHTQPTTPTTTDIYTMEPIVPEVKVSTEGWKTCRNEEYGYEFKFPAEWSIYGLDARSVLGVEEYSGKCTTMDILLSETSELSDVTQKLKGRMHVDVRESSKRSIKELINNYNKNGKWELVIYDVKKVPFLYAKKIDGSEEVLVAQHNEQMYTFTIYQPTNGVLETIASSMIYFAPTPIDGSVVNPEWLTYEDNSITFTYPRKLCNTTWLEANDMYWCEMIWTVSKRGKENTVYHIMPPNSSYYKEFGGTIQIVFVTKQKYNEVLSNNSNLEEMQLSSGLTVFHTQGASESKYFISDNGKYVVVNEYFPDQNIGYMEVLLNSIRVK